MSLTINLSPDAEGALTELARESGRAAEEYAADLVARSVLPLQFAPGAAGPPPKQGSPEWLAEFRAWIASHEPVKHYVDDSRETIYGGPEGRGE